MKRLILLAAIGALFLTSIGCGPKTIAYKELEPGQRLQVLTTFFPLYCLAANVAGDAADVKNLLPPGVGPHDYQFTPQDMRTLAGGHVVILNGLGLESWLDRAIANAASGERPRRFEVTSTLREDLIPFSHAGHEDHDHGHHHHGEHDPHFWLDPRLAAKAAFEIGSYLAERDPANASIYQENAKAYAERLNKLDEELEQRLSGLSDAPFITFHDAFGYLVNRYGLKQAGVVEAVPDVEPSPQDLKKLYETIRESGAKIIFTEPQFSAKLANQIAKDLSLQIGKLDPLETGPFEPEGYEKSMKANADALVRYLSTP